MVAIPILRGTFLQLIGFGDNLATIFSYIRTNAMTLASMKGIGDSDHEI